MIQYRTTRSKSCAYICLTLCAFVMPISVTMTTITYLLAFFMVLISGDQTDWTERWHRIRYNPAAWSFWVLGSLFLIGLIYTHSDPQDAWRDLHKRHWMFITPFLIMLIDSDVWRKRIINAFVTAMVLTLILALLKPLHIDPVDAITHQHLDTSNVFFSHIVQNFFMSIATFIVGYRFLFDTAQNKAIRYFYATTFVLMSYCILFLSDARIGYIVFLSLLAYLALLRFGLKGLVIAGATGILLLAAAYSSSSAFRNSLHDIPKEYQRYAQGDSITSIGLRIGMWENARVLIQHKPWFGYGTGGIRAAMHEQLTPEQINRTGPIDYVEYAFLNFLLEFGIIGFCVFISVIIAQIIAIRSIPIPEYRHMIQAFLLAFLIGSLFNSFFVSFCETHLYSIISAICFSAIPSRKSTKSINT